MSLIKPKISINALLFITKSTHHPTNKKPHVDGA
tara:strand:- start:105 stop:206 length:102 start_codon:yes stop_codon:yes gene_type:complete